MRTLLLNRIRVDTDDDTRSGCVVFGRVAGDSAAAYQLQHVTSAATANARLGQVGGHLGMATTIRIDPSSKKVHLEFSWDDNGPNVSVVDTAASHVAAPAAIATAPVAPMVEEKAPATTEFTLADVAKHNKKDDVWVVVDGVVLDCTKFLPDHPGGPKA